MRKPVIKQVYPQTRPADRRRHFHPEYHYFVTWCQAPTQRHVPTDRRWLVQVYVWQAARPEQSAAWYGTDKEIVELSRAIQRRLWLHQGEVIPHTLEPGLIYYSCKAARED